MDNICPLLGHFRQKKKFLPHYEVTDTMRPISAISMSSGCLFIDACPCAPHYYVSVPDHRPRFVPSCQFFSKLQRKLTPNPVLSKWSPFANPPVQSQRPSPNRRSHVHSNAMEEHHACPEPSSPDPAANQQWFLPAGDHVWCCPPSLPLLNQQWGVSLHTLHTSLKRTRGIRCYFFCLC